MADARISELTQKSFIGDDDDLVIVDTAAGQTKKVKGSLFAKATDLDTKVDVVVGKGLSTNDYTDADSNKVSRTDTNSDVSASRSFSIVDDGKLLYLRDSVIYTFGSNAPASFTVNFRCENILGTEESTVNFNSALLGEDGLGSITAEVLDAGDWMNVTRLANGNIIISR